MRGLFLCVERERGFRGGGRDMGIGPGIVKCVEERSETNECELVSGTMGKRDSAAYVLMGCGADIWR